MNKMSAGRAAGAGGRVALDNTVEVRAEMPRLQQQLVFELAKEEHAFRKRTPPPSPQRDAESSARREHTTGSSRLRQFPWDPSAAEVGRRQHPRRRVSTHTLRSKMLRGFARRDLRPLFARRSNIVSSLTDRFQKGNARRSAELFRKQTEAMTMQKRWTLRHFLDQIEKTQSDAGWRMSLPGVRSSTEVETMKRMHKILSSMRERELDGLEPVSAPRKREIAAESENGVEEINQLLFQFEQAAVMHRWLRSRHEEGRPLPSTQEEMRQMMAADPRGIANKPQTARQKALVKKMQRRGGGLR